MMERWRRAAVAACVCAGIALAAAGAAPREDAGALAARLRDGARATVHFERVAYDPIADAVRIEPGTLALETGRADVRFTRTGERLTVRPDGGEWLQPELKQMLVLGPEGVASARHWWDVLLSPESPEARVVRRGDTWVVTGPGEAGRDTARVRLGAAGLPERLEVVDGGGRTEYRFGPWTFGRAKGRRAFVQKAAGGVDIVRMP